MADEAKPAEQQPSFAIKGQYIKDLSFENPRAPESLVVMPDQPPRIDLNVNIKVDKVQENVYETMLHVDASAKGQNGTLFLVDLKYAGLFELVGIPEDRLQPILFVDCPFVLYPFARRVVADVTRDGGFPPLTLDNIDFIALYRQQLAQRQAQQAEGGETAPAS